MSLYIKGKADRVEEFLYKSHYGNDNRPAHKNLPTWKRIARVIVRTSIVGVVITGISATLTAMGALWYFVALFIYDFLAPILLPTQAFIPDGVGFVAAILALLIFIPLVWGIIWEYKD